MNEPTRKVAICGTAPGSLDEAPWADPEWEIWGTSRLYEMIPDNRWDCWFELHDLEKIGKGWNCTEQEREEKREKHLDYLRETSRPVYVQPQYEDEWPSAIGYPIDEVLDEFPSQYFTNHISWMLALAIYSEVDEIGIYGVDMAMSGGEYEYQRPSVEYFIGVARGRGIPVEVPDTCDLLKTTRLYGVDDGDSPFDAKVRAREDELDQRINSIQQTINELEAEDQQIQGMINVMGQLAENGVDPNLRDELVGEAEALQERRQQIAQQLNANRQKLAAQKGAKDNTDYLKRAWMS